MWSVPSETENRRDFKYAATEISIQSIIKKLMTFRETRKGFPRVEPLEIYRVAGMCELRIFPCLCF